MEHKSTEWVSHTVAFPRLVILTSLK